MNKNIAESLEFFERSINMLNDEANCAIERYNKIMKDHFGGKNLKPVIEAAGGNFVLNVSKAAAVSATTEVASSAIGISGSTAAALPGSVAAGTGASAAAGAGASAAALPAIAIALAAIGGLIFGKAIGEFGVGIYDRLVVGKGELEDLDSDVKKHKEYCKIMYEALTNTYNDLSNAKNKISASLIKLNDQEYKTKESNVKRIKYREAEIDAILKDIVSFMKVINTINGNLSELS